MTCVLKYEFRILHGPVNKGYSGEWCWAMVFGQWLACEIAEPHASVNGVRNPLEFGVWPRVTCRAAPHFLRIYFYFWFDRRMAHAVI